MNRKRAVRRMESSGPAFLFDLDGTLVDSVYQHVLAWRDALEQAGIGISVWRIHRRIGMSGGLIGHALLRDLAAAKRLKVEISESIVVGDSVRDLLAARRARALGGYGQNELERAGAYRVY